MVSYAFFAIVDPRPEDKTQLRGLSVARSRTTLVVQQLTMTEAGALNYHGVRGAERTLDAAKLCDLISFRDLMRATFVWRPLPGSIEINVGAKLPLGCVPEPLQPPLAGKGRGGRGRGAGVLAIPKAAGPLALVRGADYALVAQHSQMTPEMVALTKELIDMNAFSATGLQVQAASMTHFNDQAVANTSKTEIKTLLNGV